MLPDRFFNIMSRDSSDRFLPFPSYLLPSLNFPGFRRRRTSLSTSNHSEPPSLSSSSNTSPSSSPPSANFLTHHFHSIKDLLQNHIDSKSSTGVKVPAQARRLTRDHSDVLKCITCGTDIAFSSQIVSKGFTGRHGRAFLVAPPSELSDDIMGESDVLHNTRVGKSVNRQLLTGAHVVADVTCVICDTVLGWKYVDAKEHAQKYKIGKFIVETKRVVSCANWEDDVPVHEGDEEQENEEDEGLVVFDSEDEDECDDLFAGTWDAATVAKRRGSRLPLKRRTNTTDE